MLGLEQFEELITEFERLPSRVPSRTLMEVAGYPHYENVCSNILAFYFDPAAEHGLKDFLIRALMVCLGIEWESSIQRADVGREVYSEQRGRLDILIEAEGLVVGIENKIWAGLGNDLHDYRDLISSRAVVKRILPDSIHYVVLSLHPLDTATMAYVSQAGFSNLTYTKLLDAARSLLGHYAAQANLKFLCFFSDFMQTIENLIGPRDDADTSKFFAKNGIIIEELCQKYWRFRNGKAPALIALTRPWLEEHLKEDDFKQSIYEKTTVITHIRASGEHREKAISVDLAFAPGNWAIVLFSRGFSDYKKTAECNSFFKGLMPILLAGLGTEWVKHEDAGLMKTFALDTPDGSMALILESVFLTVMNVLGYQIEGSNPSYEGGLMSDDAGDSIDRLPSGNSLP